VALALAVRLGLFQRVFQRVGLDIYIHDAYRVIPFARLASGSHLGLAAVWLLVTAYTSARHSP
jgi:hypothetical protein